MVLFFFIFSFFLLMGASMVITSSNPVHSVLWLIFTFCNASGLMILLGAEFLAMMLIIIYVGAVAVLFLFVVMMLDIKYSELKSKISAEAPFSFAIAFVLFLDLLLIITAYNGSFSVPRNPEMAINNNITNAHAIGQVLYTTFILHFQSAGIILLIAMFSCIALTIQLRRRHTKRQDVLQQLSRTKDNSLSIKKIELNSGLGDIDYDK
jgi:NADH-quinone oxidoreductase subunit J